MTTDTNKSQHFHRQGPQGALEALVRLLAQAAAREDFARINAERADCRDTGLPFAHASAIEAIQPQGGIDLNTSSASTGRPRR